MPRNRGLVLGVKRCVFTGIIVPIVLFTAEAEMRDLIAERACICYR